MATNLIIENRLTPSQLVDALNALSVPFLRGGSATANEIEPDALITGLANSTEARLRLALIPLFLRHPEFSTCVTRLLQQLTPSAAVTLRCYYTAAYWLQKKHHARLAACLGVIQPLPDLFGIELDLTTYTTPDAALHALADRQQALSGRVLNWFGSYEHAVQSWLRPLEQEIQWNQSRHSKSKSS